MATEVSIAEPQQIVELPTPNLPLLRKVLDHIDAHPEEWDQNWWEATPDVRRYDHDVQSAYDQAYGKCGTTRCVAGWVQYFTQGHVDDDSAADVAARELGLTGEEANKLFWETSYGSVEGHRDAVQAVAEAIAARAGERL